MSCVHYAHAGSGEIHLQPIINLKTKEGQKQFRVIAEKIVVLVKKYKGSLSGEHGDGRLRGEFIKKMIGKENYALIDSVKKIWDSNNIFNPEKIINTPPIDSNLIFEADKPIPETKRSIPRLANVTLKEWFEKNKKNLQVTKSNKKNYFFCDEFTNYLDVKIGQKAIKVLTQLGYEIEIPNHTESGRTLISRGMLCEAKKIVNENIKILSESVNEQSVMVGIEPSALLTIRDEYPNLCNIIWRKKAKQLASNPFTFEEFINCEHKAEKIDVSLFSEEKRHFKIHGHCHQKVLSSVESILKCISIPKNYTVENIPSRCCGMAGSFGYEKEHYEVSMQIGKLILFPAIEKQKNL